jgi:hypothetical protein
MTDTPRTDAAVEIPDGYGGQSLVVSADFARQLERELAAAEKALRIAAGMVSTMPFFSTQHPDDALRFLKESAEKMR